MSKQTRQDRQYMKFVRDWPCVVAVAASAGTAPEQTRTMFGVHGARCSGPVEFCHLEHAGMGGKRVPVLGNGFPACNRHHQNLQAGFHGLGVESFQQLYGLPLIKLCLRLEQYFLFGVPFAENDPIPGLRLVA